MIINANTIDIKRHMMLETYIIFYSNINRLLRCGNTFQNMNITRENHTTNIITVFGLFNSDILSTILHRSISRSIHSISIIKKDTIAVKTIPIVIIISFFRA